METTTKTIIEEKVELVGGWKNIRGDGDVHTDDDDPVYGILTTVILHNKVSNQVYLDVTYDVREVRGDRTRIEGTRRKILFYGNKFNRKIEKISVEGDLGYVFKLRTDGKNYTYNNVIQPSRSFWKTLKFRVDSKFKDDSPHIGIIGEVKLTIETTPITC